MGKSRRVIWLLQLLAYSVVTCRSEEACAVTMDLVFLVDGSGSIGSSNFDRLKEFVSTVIGGFVISPQGTQISVVVYHSSAKTHLSFGDAQDLISVRRIISSIAYPSGPQTYTDRGLVEAHQRFAKENGARSSRTTRVVVVINDGKSNGESLEASSKPLKDEGIVIMALGFGSSVRVEELQTMASSQGDMHLYSTAIALKNDANSIVNSICMVNRKSQLYFTSVESDVSLTSHVISSDEVEDDLECAFRCLRHQRCFSFNFWPASKSCQLNSSSKVIDSDDVIPDKNAMYYGMTFSRS
ncbi:predicted protein [Nematostella vectensis]|uniref:Uncharacterized protein n=1 Tax=Nematostella vectensis TaxID=45351 RepID=A7S7H3_NEMVE|nr:matrilin-2 [Nematostella vectensis]EDO40308.1 predicted protein [Nematostella vectensis]|eukprot:XP_001632371.1 predicted protein [Nematostella vectensis]